ncbi:MAG: hypothetical protein ACFFD4_24375 [Candidatus Odinarchaeota archaeon]
MSKVGHSKLNFKNYLGNIYCFCKKQGFNDSDFLLPEGAITSNESEFDPEKTSNSTIFIIIAGKELDSRFFYQVLRVLTSGTTDKARNHLSKINQSIDLYVNDNKGHYVEVSNVLAIVRKIICENDDLGEFEDVLRLFSFLNDVNKVFRNYSSWKKKIKEIIDEILEISACNRFLLKLKMDMESDQSYFNYYNDYLFFPSLLSDKLSELSLIVNRIVDKQDRRSFTSYLAVIEELQFYSCMKKKHSIFSDIVIKRLEETIKQVDRFLMQLPFSRIVLNVFWWTNIDNKVLQVSVTNTEAYEVVEVECTLFFGSDSKSFYIHKLSAGSRYHFHFLLDSHEMLNDLNIELRFKDYLSRINKIMTPWVRLK